MKKLCQFFYFFLFSYDYFENNSNIFCSLECLTEDHEALSNDTLYFMATANQSLSCFEQYQVLSKVLYR